MDQTVVQPDSAVFTCRATARPRPEVTWHTQDDSGMDVDITNELGVTNIVEQEFGERERMSTLTIVGTQPRDAGNYTCRARNLVEEVDASAILTVHGMWR